MSQDTIRLCEDLDTDCLDVRCAYGCYIMNPASGTCPFAEQLDGVEPRKAPTDPEL